MEKKYNPSEYNNAVPCEVCGRLTFADDYGNTDVCRNCGWKSNSDSEFYEMLFWHKEKVYEVFRRNGGVVLSSKDSEQKFISPETFYTQASINGRLLKDIWVEVMHPCFMFCAKKESDYDYPPED